MLGGLAFSRSVSRSACRSRSPRNSVRSSSIRFGFFLVSSSEAIGSAPHRARLDLLLGPVAAAGGRRRGAVVIIQRRGTGRVQVDVARHELADLVVLLAEGARSE